jgi:anti-sigma factor RsiW
MSDPQGGPISEDDLQAFIDDRLTEARRAQVESYLAENPEMADGLALDRAYRDGLRAKLAGKFTEPIPARLRISTIRSARRAVLLRRMRTVAAVLAIFIVGVVSGWISAHLLPATATSNAATVADNATTAYRIFVVEVAHPVEVPAAQQEHLLRWLSKRLGRPLVAPDLSKFGYQLIGGRLLPGNEGAAAQLMYENSSHQRLTIYVQAEPGSETAFRFWQAGDASTFAWIDRGFGFAVTAHVSREHLFPIAEAVYHALSDSSGNSRRDSKGQS